MDVVKMFIRMVDKLESRRVIDQTTGCWLYTGNRRPNGYGYLMYQSKNHSVHRLSAHVWLDMPLDSIDQVNHKKICPYKHCFNPEHIYCGNQSQNLHDHYGDIRDRLCPNGHSMQFAYIYKGRTGKIYRWCRTCRMESNARRRKK